MILHAAFPFRADSPVKEGLFPCPKKEMKKPPTSAKEKKMSANAVTLLDAAKRFDNTGKIAKLVEIMAQTNEILEDALWLEGNLPTGHRTTVRTGLPAAAWRILNYGVQPSKSTTKSIDDTCGMLEAYAEVDKSLADLNGASADWRMSEEAGFVEAMNQEMAKTLFYGDIHEEPQKFMGLSPRYNALSGFDCAENVLDFGGTGGANTSIWLCGWGEDTLHGIFPKGSQAGLQIKDLGEQTLLDDNGGHYQGYRSHFKWDCGLSLRDWRYAVRICNIDTASFADIINGSAASVGTNLIRLMIAAANKIPSANKAQMAWYMNRDVKTVLDIMAMEKANVQLSVDQIEGKPVTRFLGMPVRRVDALHNNEERLV